MRRTQYTNLLMPENDDVGEILTQYRAAADFWDARIGRLTSQGWVTYTAPTTTGFTTSAKTQVGKWFGKTLMLHNHLTIATATTFFEAITSSAQVGYAQGYETNNESSWPDLIGHGLAHDVSTGFMFPIDCFIGTLGTSSARVEFHSGSTLVSNTNPFTWAAGDVLSYTLEYETSVEG